MTGSTSGTGIERPSGPSIPLPDSLLWRGDELTANAGVVEFPDAARRELDIFVEYLNHNPLPTLALDQSDFSLEHTRALATQLRQRLQDGLGFGIVDRLPIEDWGKARSTDVYWLLSSCVGRPVAQSWDGKMLYDVRDQGRPPGNGVRPDVTRVGQNFHTDNSYNHRPPAVVGLLCLQTARAGGRSGIISFPWAYREMAVRHPALLERLLEPFYFDRQKEHAPGDDAVTFHPLFEFVDGSLRARLSRRQVVNGYQLAGQCLDPQGAAALDAFEAILNEPGAALEFEFAPGQIQFVNNFRLGHRRDSFEDWEDPQLKRHLVRLWLRDDGRRGYNG